ncbi:MAG: CHAT domain-containing protein, partial [Acidobacteria bacterium]|nr:CHAT domain-containing protein [Acidobacteriota bacterium]
LVTLSACSTARGRHVRGDAVLGFGRTFLAAGASRLLLSLWDVHDGATAELMTHFYRAYLDEGLPAPAALREAQRRLRSDPDYAHPHLWAGFELQGDWR